MRDQPPDEGLAPGELVQLDELVGLVRLRDVARPAHHGRDARVRVDAGLGAVGDLVVLDRQAQGLPATYQVVYAVLEKPL